MFWWPWSSFDTKCSLAAKMVNRMNAERKTCAENILVVVTVMAHCSILMDLYAYSVYTIFLAGISPNVRSSPKICGGMKRSVMRGGLFKVHASLVLSSGGYLSPPIRIGMSTQQITHLFLSVSLQDRLR
jgi:hypothetical protein